MNHPSEHLLHYYALGELIDTEAREIEAHLVTCLGCQRSVSQHLRAFLDGLGKDNPFIQQASLSDSDPLDSHLSRLLEPEGQPTSWPGALTKRLRVLLHAHPLLDLQRWDLLREDLETQHYDSLSLAMRVLDRIVESTGLGTDADPDTVMRALEPLLAQSDQTHGVAPDSERHTRYAKQLIARLRNDRNSRRPFQLKYTDFADGRVVRRDLGLRLLEERFVSDERTVLQLSAESANLFLNALDLEIEDAQAALEAIIGSQLERGRFDEAAQAAQDAKFRSQQYEDKIERILRDTRRDLSRIDWRESVPKLLSEAVQHIAGRLRMEEHISDSARLRLEHLEPGSREAERVARIAELMDDCFDRHTRLHGLLIGARGIFFGEQERQAFVPRVLTRLPHLLADVLEPLMEGQLQQTLPWLEEGAPALLGPHLPAVFSIERLIAESLRPRQDRRLTALVQQRQWHPAPPDPMHFSPEVEGAARPYVDPEALPVALSSLLEQAQEAREPQNVLEWLALYALQAFEPAETACVHVSRTEGRLQHAGFFGDDLWLEPSSHPTPVSQEQA